MQFLSRFSTLTDEIQKFRYTKKYANMEIPIIHFDVVKKILVVSKTKGEKKNYCIQIRLHINFYLAKMFACSKKLVHFSSQHSFLDFFIVLCLTLLQQTSFTCLISFKSFSFFFAFLYFVEYLPYSLFIMKFRYLTYFTQISLCCICAAVVYVASLQHTFSHFD